nr:MAG TPA: hypothetical protein [Caudoviricetes sp.]
MHYPLKCVEVAFNFMLRIRYAKVINVGKLKTRKEHK